MQSLIMRASTVPEQDEDLKDHQVADLREIFNRFKGRKLKAREFRILQGVLQNDFGVLEQAKKQAKMFQKQDFMSENVKLLNR